jgi:predicted dehydrogenase
MGRRMDTAATIHLEFESGVRGNIRVSHLGLLDNSITVEGSKGFVRASLVDPYVTLNLVDGALFPQGYGAKLAAKGQEPFAELWSRFIACARQGALNGGLCGALEGGRVIQIIDELYENGACPES